MSTDADDLSPIERALERVNVLPLDAVEATPSDPPEDAPRLFHYGSRKHSDGMMVTEQPTRNLAQSEEDWLECDTPAEVRL